MPIQTLEFHETIRRYTSQGWFFAGAGTRATVLFHSHVNMAVKISIYDGMWENSASDGYLWYVRTFRRHPSPHAPRIYNFFIRPGFSVIHLEKLQPIRTGSHPNSFMDFVYEVRDFGYEHGLSWDGPNSDYDTWNCMERADGTRVLTDPWCGRYDFGF